MTKEEMDAEANEFAMLLLVPDSLLEKEKKLDFDWADDEGIAKLARKYGVSVGAMAIRLRQFKQRKRNATS